MKRPEVVTRSEQWFEYQSILLEAILNKLEEITKQPNNETKKEVVAIPKAAEETVQEEKKKKGRPKKVE